MTGVMTKALWQKSSYDRVIRYNETVEAAVNYVLNNPIRKGIVDRWEDYPFSAIIDSW
jgi:REP element-mobilizing transposase RayT